MPVAEAGPHHAATGWPCAQRKALPKRGQQLVDEEAGVALIVGVFAQPVARIAQRHHDLRDLQPVDEVVEHVAKRGVMHVVVAVVNQQ